MELDQKGTQQAISLHAAAGRRVGERVCFFAVIGATVSDLAV